MTSPPQRSWAAERVRAEDAVRRRLAGQLPPGEQIESVKIEVRESRTGRPPVADVTVSLASITARGLTRRRVDGWSEPIDELVHESLDHRTAQVDRRRQDAYAAVQREQKEAGDASPESMAELARAKELGLADAADRIDHLRPDSDHGDYAAVVGSLASASEIPVDEEDLDQDTPTVASLVEETREKMGQKVDHDLGRFRKRPLAGEGHRLRLSANGLQMLGGEHDEATEAIVEKYSPPPGTGPTRRPVTPSGPDRAWMTRREKRERRRKNIPTADRATADRCVDPR